MKVLKQIVFLLCIIPCFALSQSRVSYFSATNLKDSVRLNLSVSAGLGCAGWQVLRGTDSVNLNQIYVFPGVCGNTSYAESYKWVDYSPNKLTPNYYRIYIPPNNYSQILKIDLATNFSNLLIFPQPANDVLNISVTGKNNFYYEITIYDRFGRKQGFGSGSAAEKISLNVSGFSEGIYVFYISDIYGTIYRGKFLKGVSQ